jgi:hypothetical protein
VVVTNNHFVAKEEDASRIVATFEFEEGKEEFKVVELDPKIFFRTNKVISMKKYIFNWIIICIKE